MSGDHIVDPKQRHKEPQPLEAVNDESISLPDSGLVKKISDDPSLVTELPMTPAAVLQLQRLYGNAFVSRLLKQSPDTGSFPILPSIIHNIGNRIQRKEYSLNK